MVIALNISLNGTAEAQAIVAFMMRSLATAIAKKILTNQMARWLFRFLQIQNIYIMSYR